MRARRFSPTRIPSRRTASTLRALGLAGLMGTAVSISSCETIELPPPGCGNQLIEPDLGEACDSGNTNDHCGAPGSTAPCQPLCNADVACPSHYGCGLDGVCRTPSLTFSAGEGADIAKVRQIVAADLQGDARDELVTLTRDFQVVSFDSTRALASTARTSLRHLGDGDFARATNIGFSGEPTLLTAWGDLSAFQQLRLEDGTFRGTFVPQRNDLPASARIVPGGWLYSEGELRRLGAWPADPVVDLDLGAALPVAHPVVALAGVPSCHVALVPLEGEVITRAVRDPCPSTLSASIALADADDAIVGLWAGRFDADARDDVLVTVERGGAEWVFVAYGWDDGSFRSAPDQDPAAIPNQVSSSPVFPGYIALGDVDGNGHLDAVTRDGKIFFTERPCASERDCIETPGCPVAFATNACWPEPDAPETCFARTRCVEPSSGDPASVADPTWDQAALADLDKSGALDLVVVQADEAGFTFYPDVEIAARESLEPQPIEVFARDSVSAIATTRLGSDGVDDLALVEGVGGLSLATGNPYGPPDPPVTLDAFVPGVTQLSAIDLLTPDFDQWALALLLPGGVSPDAQRLGAYTSLGWPPIRIAKVEVFDDGTSSIQRPGALAMTTLSEHGEGVVADWGVVAIAPHEVQLFVSQFDGHVDLLGTAHADNRPALKWPEPLPTLDHWLSASLDVDHDGIDELVLLGPGEAQLGGRLQVLRAVFGEDGYLVDPPVLELAGPVEPLVVPGDAPLGDSNGDGYRPGRLVALDTTSDGIPDRLLTLTDGSPKSLVSIVPDPSGLSQVQVEELAYEPAWLTTMRLGTDDPEALVVLAKNGGVGVYRYVGPEGAPNPCFAASSSEPLRLVRCGTDVERFPTFGPSAIAAIASGDFDGDGVADLAAATEHGVEIQYGGRLLQAPGATNSAAP